MKKKFKVRIVPRKFNLFGLELTVYEIQYAHYRFIPFWHIYEDRQTVIQKQSFMEMEKIAKELTAEIVENEKNRLKKFNTPINIK